MTSSQPATFNIAAFNAQFPGYDKTYREERAMIAQSDEEHRRTQFLISCIGSGVNYDSLQKQRSNIMTNDGCVHYLDSQTNQIYSWQRRGNTGGHWTQHSPKYQRGLMHLFDDGNQVQPNKSIHHISFEETFPGLLFSNLVLQTNELHTTDDGCEYYMDKTTHLIYEWNGCDEEWTVCPSDEQLSRQPLFDKWVNRNSCSIFEKRWKGDTEGW